MGHRLKCIIVKHHTCDHDKEHEDEEDVIVESNQVGLGKIRIVC
jgi:hypothetical protein